ncbi:hypothetical protein ABEB36_000908 [Hypothenemus hampei]|uniref:Multifunctional methyltransferase subunit TRM112-like protein n=1 Tax=Hypothenemus hampei TaxID=57062 RepID=A0ABD1FDN1_HYPHA
MKLLTHNVLTSKCIRGVTVGYPLLIKATNVKVSEVEFKPDFVAKVLPKIEWDVLANAAESLGHWQNLPKELPNNYENDTDFLKKIHRVLLEVEVIQGELICPESGRKFPITNGIANMLLNEDEV